MINPEKCQCGSVSWERKIVENRYICAICKSPLWQPIETAPKDGTVIIVYGYKNDRPNVQTHFYQTAAWVGNGYTNAANSWLKDVTHWMLLPAPPKMENE
jgi:hypothetical protein